MDSHTAAKTRHRYVIIRQMSEDDISKIVELQKLAFPYMAAEGVYWKSEQLRCLATM